jgi:hypothetical protein
MGLTIASFQHGCVAPSAAGHYGRQAVANGGHARQAAGAERVITSRLLEGVTRRPSAGTRQLSEVRVRSPAVMQLPFATRHAFSDNHPATYEAVLVLVLAKATLRVPGANRDKSHGENC